MTKVVVLIVVLLVALRLGFVALYLLEADPLRYKVAVTDNFQSFLFILGLKKIHSDVEAGVAPGSGIKPSCVNCCPW